METNTTVLVFKTNINYKKDLKLIEPLFSNVTEISTWSVDLEDHDKVLRLESSTIDIKTIIKIINEAGFFCEELLD
ncbi:hypothetical protein MYP_2471 [Sporocytophaga myxococcoides]|uniref:HMA domain-containing protein n=1 Tax=Sporocytophaga myxococcoides TaxID=153721 RepID=A0A098LFN0_9BACT|nr:hypothetical protein [Sporocytophaga myxococcoides]GAL85242.1 hypothetical protein MYP_2471 [Sporocytophaga myxococcoides]